MSLPMITTSFTGAFSAGDFHRFDGVRLSVLPFLEDPVGRLQSHCRGIDLRRSTLNPDRNRAIEGASARVGQVLEQPALAL